MPRRRRVIKTLGAVGIGSVVTSGLAAAQEEPKSDTFKTVERQVTTPGGTVGGNGLLIGNTTEPFSFQAYPGAADEPKFDSAEAYRIDATMQWNTFNPVGQGPNDANLYLQQQTLDGGWKEIASGDNGIFPVPISQNEVQITVTDTGTHTTSGTAQTDPVTNEYEVSPEIQYRLDVEGEQGVSNCSITAEIQALDSKPANQE